MIEFIYIHDYMGPGYVDAACCTILRSLNYFRWINVFNILIIIVKFSIKTIIKNVAKIANLRPKLGQIPLLSLNVN